MLLCGVMIALAVVSMRRKSRREAEAASVAMTGGKGIELSGHTRSRTEYWVPPPPTPTAAGVAAAGGAVNSKNPLFGGATSKGLSGESVGSPAATNKKRRRKRPGERKSQMSAGFAEFRKVKRASTFEKFREMRGLRRKSSTNDTKNPVKKRGPSVMNVAHSDWDAFFSDEHKCDYYHNRKTGETRWTTPPEVLAKLESRGGGVAGSAGDTGSAVIAKAAGRGFGEPHVAIALGDVAFSGAKVGGGQPTAAAATWKAFSSEKGTYYCNTVTQEVSWVLPAGAKLEGEGTGGGLTQVNVEANFLHSSKRKKLEKEYVEYQTEDGKTAYHNTRTGEVSWVNPYKACAAYKPDLTAKQFGVCATCGFFKKEHGGK